MSDRGGRRDNVHQFRPQQAPAVEPFQPYYAAQLHDYTPKSREWLVDSLILRGTVALFTGPAKIGKSILLQQLLTAVSLGHEWLGHATVPCRAFGLFTEDSQDELARRQIAINIYYEIDPADYEINYSWESRDTKDGTLVSFDGYLDLPLFTPLWHQMWRHCDDDGIQVLALDPTGVVYGGNENNRRQVTVFVRELHKQAARREGAIILSAHPSKADPRGYSGSTAWLGSVRFAMSLQRPPDYDENTGDEHARVLRGLGGNYSASRVNDQLRWDRGLYVLDGDAVKPVKLDQVGRQDLEYRLLQGIRRIVEQGGRIDSDEMSSRSAPSRARRSAEYKSIPLNELYRAVDQLLITGRVIRVEVDRKAVLRPAEGPAYNSEKPWGGSI